MKTSYLAVVPFFVVGALVACGGSTSGGGGSGGNSVSGTVAGMSFTVASAMASIPSEGCTQESDGGAGDCHPISGKAVTLRFSNRAGTTCANEYTSYASITELELVIINETGVIPGTYSVAAGVAGGTTMAAAADFGATSATCTGGLTDLGSSGTITLTEMSPTHVTGSYSVTFGTDGVLSGSFDVPICDAPDASTPSPGAGPPVCQQ